MKNMGGSRKTSPLYKTYTVNKLATTIKIFLIPYLDFSLLKYILFLLLPTSHKSLQTYKGPLSD